MGKARCRNREVKDTIYASVVSRFFDDRHNFDAMYAVLRGKRGHGVSLRLLDYFCTVWCLRHECELECGETASDVYQACLDAYGKGYFDCFRRSHHFRLEKHGRLVDTTLGQLLFFKEMISRGVLKFVEAQLEAIKCDMTADEAMWSKRTSGGRKCKRIQSMLTVCVSQCTEKEKALFMADFNRPQTSS